jgi:hypothetical protein
MKTSLNKGITPQTTASPGKTTTNPLRILSKTSQPTNPSLLPRAEPQKEQANPLQMMALPEHSPVFPKVVQREKYRVRDHDSPPYGWLTGLADWLNKEAGIGQWAFTGSFAMYCWAWMKNGEARSPEDIDILVHSDKFEGVAFGLNSEFHGNEGTMGFRPPGPQDQMARIRDASLNVVRLNGSNFQIQTDVDILRSGGEFGEIENIVFLDIAKRFPVLPIADLISRKEAIAENYHGDAEEQKALEDIELLSALNTT